MLIFAKRENYSRTGSSVQIRRIEIATENHKDNGVLRNKMRLLPVNVKKGKTAPIV